MLNSPSFMPFNPKQLNQFPVQAGVYLMKDGSGTILYVGKANNLKVRLKQYFSSHQDTRAMIPVLIPQIEQIDTLVVPSEKEALLLENTLIKKHQPKYNALLKDDKTFINLMINTQHEWPMIRLIRCKDAPQEQGLYFGPYTSAFAARQTYELITKLFPLRQCSDQELKRRTRPCLLHAIKRCSAPCVSKCTRQEYDAYVQGAIQFLKGEDTIVLENLYADMKRASEEQAYERAGILLKMIRQIEEALKSRPIVFKMKGINTDALALYRQGEEVTLVQLIFREGKLIGSEHYCFSHVLEDDAELLSSFILQHYPLQEAPPQEILTSLPLPDAHWIQEILLGKIALIHPKQGEKKTLLNLAIENAKVQFHQEQNHQKMKEKMLLDLQDILKLTRYPKRIECFDSSHSGSSHPVASMVVFTDGEIDSKRYRLFTIKEASQGDDYAALEEILKRRLTRAKQEADLPDLIIVDGGKGQLNRALKVFKELDIASVDIIALTKEQGRHDKGMTQEKVFLPEHKDPIHLSSRSPILFLLQTIRDEAHRKAISFLRKKRHLTLVKSALDPIPGIGKIKRMRLLKHFGSINKIISASDKELLHIQGITAKEIAFIRRLDPNSLKNQ